MQLREYQRYLVESVEANMVHSCAVWARRTGKSATLAYSAWSWQLDNKESNITIVAPDKSLLDVTEGYVKELNPDFRGNFCTTPNQIRGVRTDILFIDEADWVAESMINYINKMLDVIPQLYIRAYGTKNRLRKDTYHFWQTLNLGPCVSVFYCGAEVIPFWDKIEMSIRNDYLNKEDYRAEILSRP